MNAIQSATKEAAIVPMRVAEEIGSVMETIIYVAWPKVIRMPSRMLAWR